MPWWNRKWNREWRVLWIGLVATYSIVAVLRITRIATSAITTSGPALKIVDLGRKLEEQGDLNAALQKYQEALTIQPQSSYGLALLGRAYHQLGEDDKALASYERALETSPRDFWVHYQIGQLYLEQGRCQDAIHKFNELVAMEDDKFNTNKRRGYVQYQNWAFEQLGHCYSKIGDRQKALEAYERYLTLNPSATDRKEVEEYVQKLKSGPPW